MLVLALAALMTAQSTTAFQDAQIAERIDMRASCEVLAASFEGRDPYPSDGYRLYLSTHWFEAREPMALAEYLDKVDWFLDEVGPPFAEEFEEGFRQFSTGTIERALRYRNESVEITCPELDWPHRTDWPTYREMRAQAAAERQIRMDLPPSNPNHLPGGPDRSYWEVEQDVPLYFWVPERLAVSDNGRFAIQIGYGCTTIYRRTPSGWQSQSGMVNIIPC